MRCSLIKKSVVGILSLFLSGILTGTMACGTKNITVTKAETEAVQTDSEVTRKQPFWHADMDCSICHVLEARSMTRDRFLAFQHAQAGETCRSCHDSSDDLAIKHRGVFEETDTRVPAKKYSQNFCLNCHGSYEELIELTKDSTVCTDKKENVVNPHDTHLGQADCYHCHRIHRVSSGVRYCYTCHHAGVFECGTCHVIPSSNH